jgi:hypothetical protein
MTVYTLAEMEDRLAVALEKATAEGEIGIRGDEGRLFVLKPDSRRSPLDVEGVDVNLSREEIVSIVRESRER